MEEMKLVPEFKLWLVCRAALTKNKKQILLAKVGISGYAMQSPNHEYGQMGNFKVYTTFNKNLGQTAPSA